MRVAKSKSSLKPKLQMTFSERNCSDINTFTYNVSALLWLIHWPSGNLQKYVNSFLAFIVNGIKTTNITLVLDGYHENRVKTFTKCKEQDPVLFIIDIRDASYIEASYSDKHTKYS